jgi:hypothetical protein
MWPTLLGGFDAQGVEAPGEHARGQQRQGQACLAGRALGLEHGALLVELHNRCICKVSAVRSMVDPKDNSASAAPRARLDTRQGADPPRHRPAVGPSLC